MRRRWPRYLLWCLLASVWTGGAFASQPPAVSLEETLIALERGWNEAFYARDVEFLDSVLADEFIVTYDDGVRGDKARELELAESFNQRVVSATQDDFIVRVYDDTRWSGSRFAWSASAGGRRRRLPCATPTSGCCATGGGSACRRRARG